MERIVFKNEYLNIVFGAILVIFAAVVYFANYIEDILPYVIGVLLILLSIKRFVFTFKKSNNKNAMFILVIELLLDFAFAGLLIYMLDHVELFVGLIIYTRGVSYLLINYVSTRKVDIMQYIFNIGYVTLGSFLIFTDFSSVTFLSISIVSLIVLVGIIYLQAGIRKLVKKDKKNEFDLEQVKKKEGIISGDLMDDHKVEIEEVVDDHEDEDVIEVNVNNSNQIDYDSLTVTELKAIAKKRKITGISQLKKADLISKIKE